MKKTSLIVILFMAGFGGLIGFNQNSIANNVTESPPIIFNELVKPNHDPLNLRVDLETGQLDVVNALNREVNINVEHKVVEIQPEYKNQTQVIEKEVYIENIVRSSKMLDKLLPIGKPVLNIP